MFQKTLTIQNKTGLHARPASQLVALAKGFSSSILIKNGTRTADAKSIIMLLSAGIKQGSSIELTAKGEDEQQAGRTLADFIRSLEE